MALLAADLVTDLDLLALDSSVLKEFGATSFNTKRQIAVTDWLRPRLEAANLPPDRHMTRRQPDVAWGLHGSTYTDLATALKGPTDVWINSLLATPATDALYVGMREPYRGLWCALTDTINANDSVLAVSYWSGQWTQFGSGTSWKDNTQQVAGRSWSKGGRIGWTLPEDWMPRAINGSLAYWVRLQASASLSAPTLAQQILPISRSRLTDPLAHYTLGLIYREAVANKRGEWEAKAKLFLDLAKTNLDTALLYIRDEFDVDNDSAVDRVEVNSIMSDPFTWERG